MAETKQIRVIEIYSNTTKNFALKSIVSIFMTFIIFLFIHELGHLLTAIIFGGKAVGLKYNNFCLYAITESNSDFCRIAVIMGGTLFACIVALLIDIIAIIRKYIFVHISVSIILFAEIISWSLNAYFGIGDSTNFLRYIEASEITILWFTILINIFAFTIFVMNLKFSFMIIESKEKKQMFLIYN